MDKEDILAYIAFAFIAIGLIALAIMLIPLAGLLMYWIVSDVMGKDVESTWYWTGVALLGTYAVVAMFIHSNRKSDD